MKFFCFVDPEDGKRYAIPEGMAVVSVSKSGKWEVAPGPVFMDDVEISGPPLILEAEDAMAWLAR